MNQLEQLIRFARESGWTVSASSPTQWNFIAADARVVAVQEASNFSGRIVKCWINGEPQRGKKFAVAMKELKS